MLTDDKHNDQIYDLHGEAITQYQLAGYMSDACGIYLNSTDMSVVKEYR